MDWWWSWVLSIIGVTGLYLAGSGKRSGWAVGVGVQVLWITYAIVSKQWGFIIASLAYGGVNIRNWIRWSKQRTIERQEGELSGRRTG
jgi:Nicotinamide mononucleotide transporter